MEAAEKQALLEKLKTEHGRVFELTNEDSVYGLVVVRPLTKLEYRAFKRDRDDENLKPTTDETYALKVIVYPPAAAAQKVLDDYPVFASSVLGEVLKISGAENLHAKKL
jgi:hypothetical protein